MPAVTWAGEGPEQPRSLQPCPSSLPESQQIPVLHAGAGGSVFLCFHRDKAVLAGASDGEFCLFSEILTSFHEIFLLIWIFSPPAVLCGAAGLGKHLQPLPCRLSSAWAALGFCPVPGGAGNHPQPCPGTLGSNIPFKQHQELPQLCWGCSWSLHEAKWKSLARTVPCQCLHPPPAFPGFPALQCPLVSPFPSQGSHRRVPRPPASVRI